VALIGEGQAAEQLEHRLLQAGWSGYQIAERLHQPEEAELEALSERGLDEIWLALPLSDAKEIHRILKGLRHTSASIRLSPDWLTFRLINHGVSDILGIPMLDLSTSPMEGLNRIVKLLEDRILSLCILILLSPLMVILAIGVKLSSKGPIFYRQERVGLNNRSFVMLKFRSMPMGTDSDRLEWGRATQKVTTRFGSFIRKTSLDELPQFINVLKGDMSIVGPRPERPHFVEQFKDEIPDYMRKHLVKAGITGWAQINGWRGDTDLQARIEHDLYYIEHWSLLLDLKIIVLTLFKIFQDPNAR
jgi:putative colanic acid biosynthesis UDP-glucose lipid carrier transferase